MNFNTAKVINKTLIATTLLFSFSAYSLTSTDSKQVEEQKTPQISTTESPETEVTANDREIERITVEGDDQISVLRYNYIRAEDSFFDAFNQLTDETDFHITCEKKKRHSFTRIKLRDCESGFEKRITNELISEVMLRNRASQSLTLPLALINAKENKAREKQIAAMEQVIQQNPELQKKLNALIEAKKKYNNARGARENWGITKD